jgi:ArsR family transcriptional regulator
VVGEIPNTSVNNGVFKALADPTRRRILRLLGQRSMTAGEVAAQFSLAKSTLSGHFNVLKYAGLIQEEKRGSSVVYSLNLSVVEEALAAIMDLLGSGKDGGSAEGGADAEDKLEK